MHLLTAFVVLLLVDGPFIADKRAESGFKSWGYLCLPDKTSIARSVRLPQLFDALDLCLFDAMSAAFLEPEFFTTTRRLYHSMYIFFGQALPLRLWRMNLQYLQRNIQRVSFVEMREPSRITNDHLHDQREQLQYLKHGVNDLLGCVSSSLSACSGMSTEIAVNDLMIEIEKLSTAMTELEILLKHTFKLLMSSLSVEDNHTSLQQAK